MNTRVRRIPRKKQPTAAQIFLNRAGLPEDEYHTTKIAAARILYQRGIAGMYRFGGQWKNGNSFWYSTDGSGKSVVVNPHDGTITR